MPLTRRPIRIQQSFDSGNVTRHVQPWVYSGVGAGAPTWSAGPGGPTQIVADNLPIVFPITRLPRDGIITAIGWSSRHVARGGSLPDELPEMSLYTGSEGSSSSLSTTFQETSATAPDVPTYEALHTVVSGALAISISTTQYRYLQFVGEHGSNSVAGLEIISVFVDVKPKLLLP